MARFHAYRNPRASRADIPFLLDVQSDLLETSSRLVVPLVRKDRYGVRYTRLNPEFIVMEMPVVASTADLAALPLTDLRDIVADLSEHRADIMSAIDFLLTGY